MIEYMLKRSRRRTLSVEVRNGKVLVRAPLFLGIGYIERFVASKSDWIKKRVIGSSLNEEKQYQEGEFFLFLGNSYQLEIKVSGNESVAISDNRIIVKAISSNIPDIERVLKKFYLRATKEAVSRILEKYSELFDESQMATIYKFYRSKWGSCGAKHALNFNAKLSMALPEVIEYVVVHELAHIRHKNHSKIFWAEVEKYDPSYKAHRKWLRQFSDKTVL